MARRIGSAGCDRDYLTLKNSWVVDLARRPHHNAISPGAASNGRPRHIRWNVFQFGQGREGIRVGAVKH